jgi:hypothetical protein
MAGINRRNVYDWLKSDPEFRREYKRVRRAIVEHLAERAMQLGEEGDSTLLIFSLKALARAKYDDCMAQLIYTTEKGLNPDGTQPAPPTVILVRDDPRIGEPEKEPTSE